MASEEDSDFNKFLEERPGGSMKSVKDLNKPTKNSDGNNNANDKILKFLSCMEENMNLRFESLNNNHLALSEQVENINARVALFEEEDAAADQDQGDPAAAQAGGEGEGDANALANQLLNEANPAVPEDDAGAEDEPENLQEGDLLDEFLKQAETTELLDQEVDGRVASIVNSLFKKKLDKDIYKQIMEEKATARPSNCQGLQLVSTNRMLWDTLSDYTKANDKKLQAHQKSVVKAGSLLTKIMDALVKVKGNPADLNLSELLTSTNKALSIMGDLNFNINMFRRNSMKSDLNDSYKKLCAETIPFTSELFGDELAKLAKDIGETNKIGNKIKLDRLANSFRGKYPSKFYTKRVTPYSLTRGGYNGSRGSYRGGSQRGGQNSAGTQRNFPRARGGRNRR